MPRGSESKGLGGAAAAAALLALLVAVAPADARAQHSVGSDVGLGSMGLPGEARSRYFTVSVYGTVELVEDRLSLDLDYGLFDTADAAAAHLLIAGVDYTPSEHWSFELALNASPVRQDVTIRDYTKQDLSGLFPNLPATTSIAGQLTQNSSQAGAELSATYDTAGFGNLEWAFDALLGLSAVNQDEALLIRRRTLTSKSTDSVLTLGAGVTAILWENTDLFARAYYYGYRQDSQVSAPIAKLAPAKQQLVVDFMHDSGMGLSLAPPRADVEFGATHRFGHKVALTLEVGGGSYEEGGSTALAKLKVVYKPVPKLRLHAGLTLQRDHIPDIDPAAIPSRYLGVGAEWTF